MLCSNRCSVFIHFLFYFILFYFIIATDCFTNRINMFKSVSVTLVYYRMRTSRAWEVYIPSSASSILPPPSVHPSSFSRTPRASRARTRAKLRGNGCLCDRGGWAAWSERRAAWVCNVRHVGHGVLNRGGTAEPRKKETDRERPRPGPARLCSRCYGPKLSLNRPADS